MAVILTHVVSFIPSPPPRLPAHLWISRLIAALDLRCAVSSRPFYLHRPEQSEEVVLRPMSFTASWLPDKDTVWAPPIDADNVPAADALDPSTQSAPRSIATHFVPSIHQSIHLCRV